MDKKTIAIIVLSSLLLVSIGLYIYQEIRLAKTPDVISRLREDNERLTATGQRLIANVDRLNSINGKLNSTIEELRGTNSELEGTIRGLENNNLQLKTRIDRLTSNYEEAIPIFDEVREIFKYYAEKDK